MAPTTETPGTQDYSTTPTSPARRGGNRNRGRGRGGHTVVEESKEKNSRGRGRSGNQAGRSGRGRGNRDGANCGERHQEKSLGKMPAVYADTTMDITQIAAPMVPAVDGEEEPEVCFICASPVQHHAVAPCNHRTCHICSLRLRALYKTKTCAHCRTESEHVVFTDDAIKNFEDFMPTDFSKSDDNLGIHFENLEIYEDTLLLLRYNCPDGDCDVACLGWPDLHRHVKTVHGKVMCDLCTRNKKVFTHEHTLFTFPELRKHQKFGDDDPGAIDQSGFTGHPECGFCRQRFYGDDELYAHCRDRHERCHICDRRSEGRKQQYYVDYDSLELHFKKEHFLCPDQECLDKKFVVFDSEMDIKAHQLEAHPNGLSKDALRDARRVDISGFHYRDSHEQERGHRREGRGRGGRGREQEGGRGRGRDPNSEPLPPSSAQPMSRAELAYQRQIAIQNSQPRTGRSFGGQLTSPTPNEAFAARALSNVPEPSTVTASRPVAADIAVNATQSIFDSQIGVNLVPHTPQEQARILRHNAVTERAMNMLHGNQMKLTEFRAQVSAYRNSKISATGLIEGFFSLFDTSSAELGKLVKELADIFEVQPKRDSLLQAWNDWKTINEDYPSLPGAAMGLSLSGGPAAHGGSRVLKLKSSTAQSSRSAVSRQASWNRTSAPSSSLFPTLPLASSGGHIGAKPGQTPWASSSVASTRASPLPTRAASSAALSKQINSSIADAFPALPAAAKPTTTIFSPGYSGAGLIRDNSGRNTPLNAWSGTGAGAGASNSATAMASEEAGAGGNKKKGNKNKKQTLFHFG